MSQNDFYKDQKDIELEVTLKTGIVQKGLRCFLLRSYSEKYDACDAHALIHFYEINGMRIDGARVEPSDYKTFKDPSNRVWKIDNYRENSPPQAPGLIFRLMTTS